VADVVDLRVVFRCNLEDGRTEKQEALPKTNGRLKKLSTKQYEKTLVVL